MIPDSERLVGQYLRQHPDMVALSARVVGRTPSDTRGAWLRVTQLDARDVSSGIDHLISFLLQIDAYAGGQGEVWTLARTAREALRGMPGVRDGGTVTAVTFAGMARIPDTDFDPARERVSMTIDVHVHP